MGSDAQYLHWIDRFGTTLSTVFVLACLVDTVTDLSMAPWAPFVCLAFGVGLVIASAGIMVSGRAGTAKRKRIGLVSIFCFGTACMYFGARYFWG
jgi:hypothetical protein